MRGKQKGEKEKRVREHGTEKTEENVSENTRRERNEGQRKQTGRQGKGREK